MTIDCQGTNLPRSNQSSMDISFHNILYEIKFKSERQGNPGEIWKWRSCKGKDSKAIREIVGRQANEKEKRRL